MNGVMTKTKLNILPLGSYEVLIGMDWLKKHKVIINSLDKPFTCVNDDINKCKVHGIPRPILVRQKISTQMKKCVRKGWKMFVVQLVETYPTLQKPSLEDYGTLRGFCYVFPEEI